MESHEYLVVEVAETDLPADHDWMLIEEPGRVTFVVKRGKWSPKVCAEGWAAYRRLIMRGRGRPSRLTAFGLRNTG